MPLYEFRLEAQDDSGHFRRGTIDAVDKDEAKRYLLEREEVSALFRLDTVELAALEEKEAAHRDELEAKGLLTPQTKLLAGKDRADLALHRQAAPYKLVSLTERKEG